LRLPFVVSVPHCSYQVPEEMIPSIALSEREILESSDIGTREVFAHLPVRMTLWSRWNPIVADLNRDYRERGPEGAIPQVDRWGRRIYKPNCLPTGDEVEERLKRYYWPYHDRLSEAVHDPHTEILFDCHSLARLRPPGASDILKWRRDFVLGNNGDQHGEIDSSRHDITCPPEMIRMIKKLLEEGGFSVSINRPYSCGFITRHYGRELIRRGKAAVQVQINQALYLDEKTLHVHWIKLSTIAVALERLFREVARRI